ncbi:MAG TPA: EAL domain-containing protein [Syntrophorhabdaceae bacterium]|nr:EAL domain-containing protein [Syntrophorhabdaceae bacterium]
MLEHTATRQTNACLAGDDDEKNKIFVGRQPILNRQKKTFGYELLFRRSLVQCANVTDNVKATANVMVNALNNIGVSKLIGSKKGFINVDASLLTSGVADLLPKKITVFEILETVKIDQTILDLCKNLKKDGYEIALDDYVHNDVSDILNIVDYVKIDVMATKRETVAEMSKILKKYKIKLVAEKVETREDFEYCYDLGYDYFQGYFFAKPSIISAKSISPTQVVLLDLSRLLAKEAEFFVLEKIFRQNPELHIKLLQFINSAAFYTPQKITSIRQSIALLGYRNLQKWVTLLLFAGEGYDITSTPLFERAVLRGRIMELLTGEITHDTASADRAFMTGVMSLIDTLLQTPLENILKELNLSEEINDALLQKEGLLGRLITIIENLEQEHYDEVKDALSAVNIDIDELFRIENNAIVEYENMDKGNS